MGQNLYNPKTYGKVSSKASTNTTLLAGGVYTSEIINILHAGIVFVNIYSNVDSASDGLEVQQSSDGTHWDHSDCYSVPAGVGKNYSINPHSQFLRVIYTNGIANQTEFRLQVVLKSNSLPSSHRIQDNISTEDDARLVKAILSSDSGDGLTFKNINVHNPLPVNGDQLYEKDIDQERSTSTNFTGGNAIDFFNNIYTVLINSTTDNPKIIDIYLKRAIQTNILGITTPTGSFSNTKISVTSGLGVDAVTIVLVDESSDNTNKTLLIPQFSPATFNRITIEFHTSDACSVSAIAISKAHQRISRIQALDNRGNVKDISCTNQGNLNFSLQEYGDTPAIDAFDRLRVSEPFTIFDSKQLHDKQPLFWDELIGGSGSSSHNPVNADTEMNVTASTSDFVIRQTKQRFNYQPGKGQLSFMTFYCPDTEGITARIGLFDGVGANYLTPNNGIFFECGDTLSWNIAKNGVITETITQENWNFDKLDGTGFSEKILDMDAAQIIIIDYEWLGVGRVRVGFVIDGLIIYCHYFNHANDSSFSNVYMSTPNLPLRYTIESDGTNAGQLDHICSTVMSEGGLEQTGILRSIDTNITPLAASTAGTRYAMIGMRLKAAYIDISVLPEYFSALCTTSDDFKWSLHLNPTVAGTFTYADITNSALQRALGVTANNITVDGFLIDSGYVHASGVGGGGGDSSRKIITALRLGVSIAGVRDELVLAITPLTASAVIYGSLTVRELL